jgi:uncharacterized protein (DUF433 family)
MRRKHLEINRHVRICPCDTHLASLPDRSRLFKVQLSKLLPEAKLEVLVVTPRWLAIKHWPGQCYTKRRYNVPRRPATMSTIDLKGIIHCDPEIMGGTPVFVGTRVPVESLFEHLKAGDSIEVFLDGFPSVKREQVLAVLELVEHEILAHV